MAAAVAVVYHASKTAGLALLMPQVGTHGKSWVYATKDIVMSAAFLGTQGGDFTCAVGRDPDTGGPYLCERFAGGLALRYREVSGAIYSLPADKFLAGQTQWEEEVVCPEPVVPLQEVRIHDAADYLLQLQREGRLTLYYYPERPADIPADDADLVYRAVLWHKQSGAMILDRVKRYHPHLVERVLQGIGEGSQT